MINVFVKGRIKHRENVLQYAETVINHLMPRIKRNVDIEINIVTKCEGENSALCWGDKDCAEIEIARESFDVKFTLDEMMLNLAHELVHAKQFIKGELHPSLNKWKRLDFTNVPYSRTPWEKEAYLLEDKLFEKYWE